MNPLAREFWRIKIEYDMAGEQKRLAALQIPISQHCCEKASKAPFNKNRQDNQEARAAIPIIQRRGFLQIGDDAN